MEYWYEWTWRSRSVSWAHWNRRWQQLYKIYEAHCCSVSQLCKLENCLTFIELNISCQAAKRFFFFIIIKQTLKKWPMNSVRLTRRMDFKVFWCIVNKYESQNREDHRQTCSKKSSWQIKIKLWIVKDKLKKSFF